MRADCVLVERCAGVCKCSGMVAQKRKEGGAAANRRWR